MDIINSILSACPSCTTRSQAGGFATVDTETGNKANITNITSRAFSSVKPTSPVNPISPHWPPHQNCQTQYRQEKHSSPQVDWGLMMMISSWSRMMMSSWSRMMTTWKKIRDGAGLKVYDAVPYSAVSIETAPDFETKLALFHLPPNPPPPVGHHPPYRASLSWWTENKRPNTLGEFGKFDLHWVNWNIKAGVLHFDYIQSSILHPLFRIS